MQHDPRHSLPLRPASTTTPAPRGNGIGRRVVSLDDVLRRLREGWVWLASGGVLALLGTLVAATMAEPIFVAEGSVVVTLGREFRYKGGGATTERTSMFRLTEAVNSEVEILDSRGLAGRVIDAVGVERLYAGMAEEHAGSPSELRERAVGAFREDLTVIPVPESSIVRVLFRHSEPALAARVVDLAVENLIELHLEVFGEDRADVLAERQAALEERLDERRRALADLRAHIGVYDVERQFDARVAEFSELEIELERVRARAAELRTALDAGEPQRLLSSALVGESRSLDGVRSELLRLTLEEQALLQNFREDSRQVTALRRSIDAVSDFLTGTLQTDLAGLEAREELIGMQLEDLSRSLRTLERQGHDLSELEREVVSLELRLDEERGRLEDARLSRELDERKTSSVRPLDPAALPVEPLGAPLWTKLFAGFVAGILLGAAALFAVPVLRGSTEEY